MEKPIFKTFAVTEGPKEWAKWAFALVMLVIRGQGLQPSKPAQDAAQTILKADCNTFKGIYRDAAQLFHPDKNDSDTNADMALINNAYEKRKGRGCLSGEKKRAKAKPKANPKANPKAKKAKPKAYPKAKQKAKPKAKPKAKQKAKPKAKPKANTKANTKAKEEGISTCEFVAGIGMGCVVGYTMKQCRDGHKRERLPRVPSRGRLTRSSD